MMPLCKSLLYILVFLFLTIVYGQNKTVREVQGFGGKEGQDDSSVVRVLTVTPGPEHEPATVEVLIGLGVLFLVICLVLGLWKCFGRSNRKKEANLVAKRKYFGRWKGVSREDSFRHLQIYNSVPLSEAGPSDQVLESPGVQVCRPVIHIGKHTSSYNVTGKPQDTHKASGGKEKLKGGRFHKLHEPDQRIDHLETNDEAALIHAVPEHPNFILKPAGSKLPISSKREIVAKATDEITYSADVCDRTDDQENDDLAESGDCVDGRVCLIEPGTSTGFTVSMSPRKNNPKTSNLVYGNGGTWKTDIPTTPEPIPLELKPLPVSIKFPVPGLPVVAGGGAPSVACSADVTRDLIVVSPDRHGTTHSTQEESAERELDVLPSVHNEHITSDLMY